MGYQLKTQKVEDDMFIHEEACERYVCRSCGRKMISVNFINGMCIQVFVTHDRDCAYYGGEPQHRTAAVGCETCAHFDTEKGCTFEGEMNSRMMEVRTNIAG